MSVKNDVTRIKAAKERHECVNKASFELEWREKDIKRKMRVKLRDKIAGRLSENRRNSFVDLQSQKNSKKHRPKK